MKRKHAFLIILFIMSIFFGCKANTGNENTKKNSKLYKILPENTDGSGGTNSVYVEFGHWPQTIKSEQVRINNSMTKNMGGFVCYLGDDGNYYVKCNENAYESGYVYSDNSSVQSSLSESVKYFKVEPIKWRVLNTDYKDTGKLLLFSEKVLCVNAYYNGYDRKIDDVSINESNYIYSTIRAFLNGRNNEFAYESDDSFGDLQDFTDKGFLYSAFSSEEISIIEDQNIKDNYKDKVFLLDSTQIKNQDYGFNSNEDRKREPSDYALASGYNCKTSLPIGGYWVSYYGGANRPDYINVFGECKSSYINSDENWGGVVPAVCIKY